MNIDKARYQDWSHGEQFQARIARIGAEMGSNKLGFNITEIAPGKCAFPRHSHNINEELFFILEGNGRIRIGDEIYPIRQGDFINIPPGKDHAHQIRNDTDKPLRFIAISTMQYPDITEYPDSGKCGVFSEPPTRPGSDDAIRKFYKMDNDVEYWEGEE